MGGGALDAQEAAPLGGRVLRDREAGGWSEGLKGSSGPTVTV